MSKQFSVNVSRFDPYKNYRFLVYFDQSTTPVAGVSKVGALKRTTEVIETKEGGNGVTRKGTGRTAYEPIVLERGVTHDDEFEEWADATQKLETGEATNSLGSLRRTIRIVLQNEAGQPVHQYTVHRCWVSEFQALPELDAGGNAVAIETLKLENEGWERDPTVTEPNEGET